MKDNKLFQKILLISLIIISSPFILFGLIIYFIIYILPSPIEKHRYKKSYYYRDLKIKYSFGITYIEDYEIYNLFKGTNIKRMTSSIKDNYVYYETEKPNKRIILLLPWFEDLLYDSNDLEWKFIREVDRDFPESFENGMRLEVLENIGQSDYEVKVLVNENYFNKNELPIAYKSEHFIIYNKNNLSDILEKLKF